MVALEQNIAVWAASAVIAFILYRVFFGSTGAAPSSYEHEINDILTSEKYKVKGRFEE